MTEPVANGQRRITVAIYRSDPCTSYAYETVALIRCKFPAVAVHVIRLGESGVDVPASVFATPTYLLNGQRWSLGNPSPDEVHRRLAELVFMATPQMG